MAAVTMVISASRGGIYSALRFAALAQGRCSRSLLANFPPRDHSNARSCTPECCLDRSHRPAWTVRLCTHLHETAAGIGPGGLIAIDRRLAVVLERIIRDPHDNIDTGFDPGDRAERCQGC